MNRQIYAATTLSGRRGCCSFCFGYLKSEEIEIEEISCVCGNVYCSQSCQHLDHLRYHWLLCSASSHPAEEYERMSNMQQYHDKVTWKLLGVTIAAFISSAHEAFICTGRHSDLGSLKCSLSSTPQSVLEPSLISATIEDAVAHLEKKWNELMAVVESQEYVPVPAPLVSDTFEEAFDVLISGCVCAVDHSQVLHPLFFKAVQQFCHNTMNPYEKEAQEWHKLVFMIQKQQKIIYKDGYNVIEARKLVSAATNMTQKSQRLVRNLTSIMNIHNNHSETSTEEHQFGLSGLSSPAPTHRKRSREDEDVKCTNLSDRNMSKTGPCSEFAVDELDEFTKASVQYQRSCMRLSEAAINGNLAAACNSLAALGGSESKLQYDKGDKRKTEEVLRPAKEGATIEIAAIISHLPQHSCIPTHSVELVNVTAKNNSLPIIAELVPIALGSKMEVSATNVAGNQDSNHVITVSCQENCSALSSYHERQRHLRDVYKASHTTTSGQTTMECPCILCEYERWHYERGIEIEEQSCFCSHSHSGPSSEPSIATIATIFKHRNRKDGGKSSGSSDANTLPKHIYNNLKDIAYAYMRANKMKFALYALHACLTSSDYRAGSNDGDIWYALGAALLSVPGKWQEAHSVWEQGFEQCPTNTQLSATVRKLRKYKEIQSFITSVEADTCEAYGGVASHEGKIMLTKDPIITTTECQQAISASEEYAENNGWTTSRHYAVPTTDVPMHLVPKLFEWLDKILLPRILPIMSKYFFSTHHSFGGTVRACVHDAFLVKYDAAAGQRYLPLHTDESTHSLTVALNSIDEYAGGGTYFDCLNGAIRPTRGQILAFDGNLLHGGDPLLTGTRYIVAIFLFMATVPKIPTGIEQSKYINLLSGKSAPESTTQNDSAFSFSFL